MTPERAKHAYAVIVRRLRDLVDDIENFESKTSAEELAELERHVLVREKAESQIPVLAELRKNQRRTRQAKREINRLEQQEAVRIAAADAREEGRRDGAGVDPSELAARADLLRIVGLIGAAHAKGKIGEDEIASWVRMHWQHAQPTHSARLDGVKDSLIARVAIAQLRRRGRPKHGTTSETKADAQRKLLAAMGWHVTADAILVTQRRLDQRKT